MSAAPAVEVVDVSKRYRIGAFQGASRYRTLRDTLTNAALAPWRRLRQRVAPPSEDYVWALKGVSFEVAAGVAIGIVGRNGAGKSTLLKVLSRVTDPTSGHAVIRGRVASLLEVGTGFHPELTGRENVFLNGAILGMTRREMRDKLEEIVAFAEVERFIDTPVKHYSSGMRMRLAFAVAAHLEPEILIIDEVLAVGDAAFQKKCLGRMENVAHQGRTVLFVSHNMAAVRRLCSRGVLLRDGRVEREGPVDQVVSAYLSDISFESELRFPPSPGAAAQITRLCVNNARGERTTRVPHSEAFETEIEFVVNAPLRGDTLGWQLATADGTEVMGSADVDTPGGAPPQRAAGRYVARARFPGGILNEGVYQYRVAIVGPTGEIRDYRYGTYFEIQDDTEFASALSGSRRNGVILQRLEWREERLA